MEQSGPSEINDSCSSYGGIAKGKMPRYTYYLSNYQRLLSSAKYGISVSAGTDLTSDSDSDSAESPKFGIGGVNPTICYSNDQNINVSSHTIDAGASQEGKSSSLFCAFDTEDELACASVAEDHVINERYKSQESHATQEPELEIQDATCGADKCIQWSREYASGNFAAFRIRQQQVMRNIRDKIGSTLVTGDAESYSFPVRCIYPRGKSVAGETFDFACIKQGDMLLDLYQFLQIIGSTSFSTVVKAMDLKQEKIVCLKISAPNSVAQALDEVNILNILNANPHDGIVKIHDSFIYGGCIFTVLELLGSNLYEATSAITGEATLPKLNNEPSIRGWSLDSVRSIAKDVLGALEYVHSLGIINCDVKPENVVFTGPHTPTSVPSCKLIDFGSSCFIQDRLNTYVQSRSYRAPEVVLGLPYDTKIDIWSVGCLLCEMYLLRILFPSDNDATLMASQISLLGVPPVHLLEHKMNSSFMVLPNGNVADFTVPNSILKSYLYNNKIATSVVCQDSVCDSNNDLSGAVSHIDGYDQDYTLKLDICRGKGQKFVRITEPTPCSIDAMLDSHKNPELATFASFIKALLQYDPIDRPSATAALAHPFFKN
ncbi:bifunctional Protein kinase domain/Protein kinase-like domain superfamily [Babesia duncani]|uniref:Bifunctional Protein kinase domain/Protein kinase-like domain superfamily n=1 Tax=Babesia duncani TaxID=323732 RepID=A0AAD9PKA1_9APIC|nr:bifunctional Protein kinase domain/Protein kinase-like domain superfamily [Babesia duncani]